MFRSSFRQVSAEINALRHLSRVEKYRDPCNRILLSIGRESVGWKKVEGIASSGVNAREVYQHRNRSIWSENRALFGCLLPSRRVRAFTLVRPKNISVEDSAAWSEPFLAP